MKQFEGVTTGPVESRCAIYARRGFEETPFYARMAELGFPTWNRVSAPIIAFKWYYHD